MEPSSPKWQPKVNFPQLEEIIKALDGKSIPVAGGAILGCWMAKEFDDIDVFPLTDEGVKLAKLTLAGLGYKPGRESDKVIDLVHANSFYRKVQIILAHTDAGDVYELLRRFDLTASMVAVMDKKFCTNHLAQADITKGILRVNTTLSVDSLLRRIEKYKRRGFKLFDENGEQRK